MSEFAAVACVLAIMCAGLLGWVLVRVVRRGGGGLPTSELFYGGTHADPLSYDAGGEHHLHDTSHYVDDQPDEAGHDNPDSWSR